MQGSIHGYNMISMKHRHWWYCWWSRQKVEAHRAGNRSIVYNIIMWYLKQSNTGFEKEWINRVFSRLNSFLCLWICLVYSTKNTVLFCFVLLWFHDLFIAVSCLLFTHFMVSDAEKVRQSCDCPSANEIASTDLGKSTKYKKTWTLCISFWHFEKHWHLKSLTTRLLFQLLAQASIKANIKA